MKNKLEVDEIKLNVLKQSFNSLKEPENDWQALLKGLIEQVMHDYIRLQHPLRRDQHYLKEAFMSAISCLWDIDYIITWPNTEGTVTEYSFREILAQRFGIENLSSDELHKINMGIIQKECIQSAKEYWLDKQLQNIYIDDFFCFEGRAFSIWKVEDESKVDYENMIINLKSLDDKKEQQIEFLTLCMEIISYYKEIKIKPEILYNLSEGWWEALRMNKCFKQ